MRRFTFFLISLFISTTAIAQDWQTVLSNRSACFEFSNYQDIYNAKELRVIKVDSIAMYGGDSMFFNYQTIRDMYVGGSSFACYQLNDTGWIGSSILIKNNGDNVFFNEQNDSIIIKTLAGVGIAWRLFELGSGNYLEAEITSSQVETILGVNDSVKTILLNAKNNLGQPVIHAMNNKVIKISKQHGILTPYRFFYFPGDTTQFIVSGITNPDYGRQLLTKHDIYNFNVGDLFQWEGQQRLGGLQNWIHKYDETRVLSKVNSIGGDTTTYIFDNIHYNITQIYPNITYSYSHDSDTIAIQFNQWSSLDFLPNQLYSFSGTFGIAEQFSDSSHYHDRSIRGQSDYLAYDSFYDCYSYPIGSCIFWNYYYADGLGNVAIYDGTSFPACIDYHMVYYDKGSETWGIPLNWPVILAVNKEIQPDLKIFPNPFDHVLNIDCSQLKMQVLKIKISDATGKVIKSLITHGQNQLRISTDDLSSGFYLLKLESERNTLHYKLVKN
ncbi:MAG: T9SS type A sorting domain-containing protein [Bacteroidetes bacterium]|nr:T9SS type A sorting domain-containing protein [Bacteroidota bacterium]